MYHYNLHQWLLFFFIYCFLGWVWESCYVSAKEKHWINRGFLNGPFLPIYGSGALAILVSTLPVRNTPVLVYVFGLIGATLLELVTGIVMESLFHVKYWDYSYQKFNYKGHICLTSSIAWGFFSLAMIYGIHKPIENMVLQLPELVLQGGTLILSIIVAGDFAVSFKTAMELRDIIDAMNRMKDEMNRMQRRAEIVETFLADEASQKLNGIIDAKDNLLESANEMKDILKDASREKAEQELRQLKEKQEEMKEAMKRVMNRGYRSSRAIVKMLYRNPSACSRYAKESFLEYKEKVKEFILNK